MKTKRFIGMVGAILFVTSVAGVLYGLIAPIKLSNVTYYEEPPAGAFAPGSGFTLALFILFVLVPLLLLILAGLIIWGIRNRKSLSLNGIGKWLWSHAYLILSIIAGLYLVGSVSIWLWFRENELPPSLNTIRYGESPTSGPIGYFASAEVTAQKELKFGTSSEVVL